MGFYVEKACNFQSLGVAGSSLVCGFWERPENEAELPCSLDPFLVVKGLLNSEGGNLKNE